MGTEAFQPGPLGPPITVKANKLKEFIMASGQSRSWSSEQCNIKTPIISASKVIQEGAQGPARRLAVRVRRAGVCLVVLLHLVSCRQLAEPGGSFSSGLSLTTLLRGAEWLPLPALEYLSLNQE